MKHLIKAYGGNLWLALFEGVCFVGFCAVACAALTMASVVMQ